MPLPKSAERERGRRRRRDTAIVKLRAQVAELTAAPELPDLADLDLSDPAGVIADWCAKVLTVPTGLLAGEPFRLQDWQVAWLRAALGPGIREAALATPRKLGKSGLIAALLLCHLCGPLNRAGWRCIVVSLTGSLARELRRQVAEIVEASGLSEHVKDYATPTPGRIVGLRNAEVTILAADKASGHAVGVDLAITDESGLLQENKRGLWDACYSSTSTRNGRSLHISVRGDSPMFSELRERRNDPGIVWHEYSAPDDCALDDETAWYAANPGLGTIKSLAYMRDASARAIASPAAAPAFRSLDLNLPGSPDAQTVVTIADYLRCVTAELPERRGECWVGLDCGGASAFTGAAAYWPETSRCELYAGIGGIPDLLTRSRGDGRGDLYVRMHERGELWTYPQRETPIQEFVTDLAERLDGAEIGGLIADEYRANRLRDGLDNADLKHWAARLAIRPVRWKTGNDDIIAFQTAVITGGVAFPETAIMPAAISDSRLTWDKGNNVTLDKSREHGRIDVLSAAVLAVAAGERNRRDPDAGPGFEDFV